MATKSFVSTVECCLGNFVLLKRF